MGPDPKAAPKGIAPVGSGTGAKLISSTLKLEQGGSEHHTKLEPASFRGINRL
jgi:hypothetical protein